MRVLLIFLLLLTFSFPPARAADGKAPSPALKQAEARFEAQFAKARYLGAQKAAQLALRLREKEFGPSHPSTAMAASRLGRVYLVRGRLKDAEQQFRRAVIIMTWAYGPKDIRTAVMRTNLAGLLEETGRYEKAEDAYRQALDVLMKNPGPAHVLTAKVRRNLAGLYVTLARYDEAHAIYRDVLDIQRKARGPEDLSVAITLNNMAHLLDIEGRYHEATASYNKALAIFKKHRGETHPNVASVLLNLAAAKRSLGLYGEAEALLRQGIAINRRNFTPGHPKLAQALNNLAGLYKDMGRFAEAEDHYRKALAIAEKSLGPAHPKTARIVNNLALLLKTRGQMDAAEKLYRRSLAALVPRHGADHPALATIYGNLADIHDARGENEAAERLLHKAMAIDRKAHGGQHPAMATHYNNLGWHYRKTGAYDRALEHYKKALALDRALNGTAHPLTAVSHANIGVVLRLMGRLEDSEAHLRKSLAIKEQVLGPNHPGTALSLTQLARTLFARGQHGRALALIRRATAIYIARSTDGPQARSGSQKDDITRHLGAFKGHVTLAWRVRERAPEQAPALLDESFRMSQWAGRTAASQALAQMALRFGAGTDALAQLVRQHQDAITRRKTLDRELLKQLGKPANQRRPQIEQNLSRQIKVLDRQIRDMDTRLAKKFPKFATLVNPRPLSITATQKLLRPKEALVRFLFTKKEGYAWLVRRDRAHWVRLDIDQQRLARLVKTLRQGLDVYGGGVFTNSGGLRFDLEASHRLYRALLGALEPHLSDIGEIIFVMSDALESLPPAVLITRKPARRFTTYEGLRQAPWLIRRHALSVLPSVASLRALRVFAARKNSKRAPFIGFGDPELEGPGTTGGQARGGAPVLPSAARLYRGKLADIEAVRRLAPLPDTAEELKTIASFFKSQGASVHLRGQAREAIIKRAPLHNFRIIAFATHGLLSGELPGLSEPALVLTPPRKASALDDGLLGASEVARLKLDADWVLLSACNTAAGEKAGAEGLSGLARAFFYAGSRALLVSHWPVYSFAAVRLTTGTFKALAQNPAMGRAAALRQSILALLDDPSAPQNAHPSTWAPFIVVGESATAP